MALGRLHERLTAVRSRIAAAASRAGRDPGAVRIVAVTKGHPLPTAMEAAAADLLDLGENRVQEALGKMDAWPQTAVRWHLIGHLQRNKVRLAVGRFALIHSLDSERLADALEEEGAGRGLVQDVLVEVNVAGEAQKAGCPPAEVAALVEYVAGLPHLTVRGLMTMAPLTDDVGGAAAGVRAAVRVARGAGGAGLPPARAVDGDDERLRGRGRGGRHDGAPRHGTVR